MDTKVPIASCDSLAHLCNLYLAAGQDIIRAWTTADAVMWFSFGFATCLMLSMLLSAVRAHGLR